MRESITYGSYLYYYKYFKKCEMQIMKKDTGITTVVRQRYFTSEELYTRNVQI